MVAKKKRIRRCSATSKSGKRCGNKVSRQHDKCHVHRRLVPVPPWADADCVDYDELNIRMVLPVGLVLYSGGEACDDHTDPFCYIGQKRGATYNGVRFFTTDARTARYFGPVMKTRVTRPISVLATSPFVIFVEGDEVLACACKKHGTSGIAQIEQSGNMTEVAICNPAKYLAKPQWQPTRA